MKRLTRKDLMDVVRSSVRLLTRDDMFEARRASIRGRSDPKHVRDKIDEYYRDNPFRKPSLTDLSINAMMRG